MKKKKRIIELKKENEQLRSELQPARVENVLLRIKQFTSTSKKVISPRRIIPDFYNPFFDYEAKNNPFSD